MDRVQLDLGKSAVRFGEVVGSGASSRRWNAQNVRMFYVELTSQTDNNDARGSDVFFVSSNRSRVREPRVEFLEQSPIVEVNWTLHQKVLINIGSSKFLAERFAIEFAIANVLISSSSEEFASKMFEVRESDANIE